MRALYPSCVTFAQSPISPEHRHLADYRDEIEHAEVARILSGLPVEHAARVAYSTGAREAADPIALSWLLADRSDPVAALVEAYLAATRRIRTWRSGHVRL